jgi:hypothetical protein
MSVQALLASTKVERAMDGFVFGMCLRTILLVRVLGLAAGRCTPTGLWVALFAVIAAGDALPAITCKPVLSIRNVREVRGPIVPQAWTWTATIAADASYCATTSGNFEVDFVRIKEYAPDVQFTEIFKWSPGRFDVRVELAADEAIVKHRIGFIEPCVCRVPPFEK